MATALRLGRRGWGVDLSETYLRDHAAKRVGAAWLEMKGPGELVPPKGGAVRL